MNLFARITKVDEAKRLVIGRLVQEVPDHADEIFDYESSKPHFKAWSDEIAKDTDGKSVGNLRAMHGKVAAGVFKEINFNDAEKAIDVAAKVVDDAEWNKVLEGVYTGFSIGGSYVGEKKAEKVDGKEVKRYTAKPSEGSLVDRPCIPTAKFFDIQKADGTVLQKAFHVEPPAEVVESFIALSKLCVDSGFTQEQLIAAVQKRGEDAPPKKADAEVLRLKKVDTKEAHRAYCEARACLLLATPRAERVLKSLALLAGDKLEKGIWTVSSLACLIGNLFDLQCDVAAEAAYENDGSMLPDELKESVKGLGEILGRMVDEEVAEMFPEGEDEGDDVDVVQLAERIGELAKRGAKHSADTMGHLQSMHDHLAKMTDGKVCAGAEKDEKTGDLAKLQAEHKTMHATLHEVQAALAKLTAERETQDAALKKAQADLAAAQAEVKRLADMPAPSETRLRGDLRVVGKTDDVNKPADEPPQPGEKPLAFNITPHPGQSGYDAVRMAFAGARSIVKSA